MIFPDLKHESIVQVDDKFRFDASHSFGDEAITLVEIEVEASAGFVDITTNKYLDWAYVTAGAKTVTLRVNTDYTREYTIESIPESDDRLFSKDEDLLSHEPDLLRWLPDGKDSFINKHRVAQEMIMDELDSKRIYNSDGSKITKDQIADLDEVKKWSKFLTLSILFNGFSNAVDDVFFLKASNYKNLAEMAASRSQLRITDSNGNESNVELLSSFTAKR